MSVSKLKNIEKAIKELAEPSTVKELAETTGASTATIYKHINVLEAQGRIRIKRAGTSYLIIPETRGDPK